MEIDCCIVSERIFSSLSLNFSSTNCSVFSGLPILGRMPILIREKFLVLNAFIIDLTPLCPAEPRFWEIFISPIGKSMSS